MWQDPAVPSRRSVRQTKLEKTAPPPCATHSQRALQKWPVRPRRPRVLGLVSLAPWPCRGRVGSCLRPGGRAEWDVLRCCGRLESARSETSGHQGNSETVQRWWPHLPAVPRPVPCPPAAGQWPPCSWWERVRQPVPLPRPRTGLRGDGTVMVITAAPAGRAGLGPLVHGTPRLDGEARGGDFLGWLQVCRSWLWTSLAFRRQID